MLAEQKGMTKILKSICWWRRICKLCTIKGPLSSPIIVFSTKHYGASVLLPLKFKDCFSVANQAA
jgi:hypothetical protein